MLKNLGISSTGTFGILCVHQDKNSLSSIYVAVCFKLLTHIRDIIVDASIYKKQQMHRWGVLGGRCLNQTYKYQQRFLLKFLHLLLMLTHNRITSTGMNYSEKTLTMLNYVKEA